MTPDEFTTQELFLDVGQGHRLYVHDWGKANARLPIIYLHGGPGDGTHNGDKLPFDPKRQRVIFFDQRGSGKSTPFGSLEHNTTPELVEDIEKIAKRLKLHTFAFTGGSWGSTLALFYAIKYPERVSGMVLSGIWTGTKAESAWLDNGQVQLFFPEVWQTYLDRTPVRFRNNPTAYHFKKALRGTAQEQKASCFAYQYLVYGVLRLNDYPAITDFENYDPASMRLGIHYIANDCFMPPDYIFKNAHKLKMPIRLVQGRYDMICPPITAYKLDQKLPDSSLIMTVGGHGAEHEAWNIIRTLLLHMSEE